MKVRIEPTGTLWIVTSPTIVPTTAATDPAVTTRPSEDRRTDESSWRSCTRCWTVERATPAFTDAPRMPMMAYMEA
jgi:hypothetical protein